MQSAAYLAEVEKMLGLNGLSPETVGALSEPQILFLTEQYRSAPVRVMVVGQETAGIEVPLANTAVEGVDSLLERQRKDFISFDYNKHYSTGPFWRGYDEVCTAFGLTSRRAAAWTNISKVQLYDGKGGSVSIEGLAAEARMEIIRWQRAMARAEIEYAKPDVIVHFTGRMRWVAGHLYGTDHKRPDVIYHQIDGAGDVTGHMTAPFLGDTIAVYTYHPAGGRTSEAKTRTSNERRLALEWAVRRLSERGPQP
ncbi:hypothetical protein AMJ96_CH03336 [Rhizobium sp. N113]|nr:hypothetical protein AMJ96_CH03336 [Rhizobium sp. N113]